MARREAILEDPVIDTEIAGHVAGLSPRRIRELVNDGTLPNRGSKWRILLRLSDITAYKNPHKV